MIRNQRMPVSKYRFLLPRQVATCSFWGPILFHAKCSQSRYMQCNKQTTPSSLATFAQYLAVSKITSGIDQSLKSVIFLYWSVYINPYCRIVTKKGLLTVFSNAQGIHGKMSPKSHAVFFLIVKQNVETKDSESD